MKSIALSLIAAFAFSFQALSLNLFLDSKQYLNENLEPYLEVQLRIPSESIEFTKNDNQKWQGAVKITLEVQQNDKVIFETEYPLFTQELDELNFRFDLVDFYQIPVGSGLIKIKIKAMDYLNGLNVERETELLYKEPYRCSDICLLDNYYFLTQKNSKSHGKIFTIPRLNNTFQDYSDTISLYLETYKKTGVYSLMVLDEAQNVTYLQYIEHTEGNFKQHIIRLPKLKIGSGKLILSLDTEEGENLKSIEIDVPKPEDKERFMALTTWEVKHYLLWIEPISDLNALTAFKDDMEATDSSLVKERFFSFWEKRNADFPWEAWIAYQRDIAFVDETFGMSHMAGFRTDRGRVYLQYGPPGNITEMHNNPQTYPYEIWQYYGDGKMGDSRFYFVNYSFTKNNFSLAHSTALGEPQNPNWKETIKRGNGRNNNNKNIGSGWENEFINE